MDGHVGAATIVAMGGARGISWTVVTTVVLAPSWVACSVVAGIEDFTRAAPAASNVQAEGGTASDGAAPPSPYLAPIDAAPDAAPPTPAPAGEVRIAEVRTTETRGGFVGATFRTGSQQGPGCTRSVDGPCVVEVCAADAGAPVPLRSAGTISVTGTSPSVTLTPDATKTYLPFEQAVAASFAAPGTTIAVKASGGDIAPFSGEVVAGEAITMVSDETAGSQLDPQGVTFKWTGSKVADVVLLFANSEHSSAQITAECAFPGSSSSGVVPLTVLLMFSTEGSSYMFGTRAKTIVNTGPDSIELIAYVISEGQPSPGL